MIGPDTALRSTRPAITLKTNANRTIIATLLYIIGLLAGFQASDRQHRTMQFGN
jgi:hypothetical protein